MNKQLLSVAIAVASIFTATANNDDPVLMTVNGKSVPLSEFEYLYNKNNSQQLQQQTIDEYLDMFVTYKLKVADAEALGLDTTATFKSEFNNYKKDLAAPYLMDENVKQRLLEECYERCKEDVDVSHIMLPLGQNAILDSLRNRILVHGEDFGEIAVKYSIDQTAPVNKGHMGYISANRFPYAFETAAYNTPIGEISQVIESPFGVHIVKPHAHRNARGTVLVRHILKLFPQDRNEAGMAATKASIDSIYQLVKGGADFAEMAKKVSEDPGSARNGGELPWFGTGRMILDFENVSFSLKNGEISEPFATHYGYHIVQRLDHKGVAPYEEMKAEIERVVAGDERNAMPRTEKLKALKKEYGAEVYRDVFKVVEAALEANNGYDSVFIGKYINDKTPIAKVGTMTLTIGDVIKKMPTIGKMNVTGSLNIFKGVTTQTLDDATIEYEINQLETKYPEYRNLVNEYRNGILLFEISNRNVWDKASSDKEGLAKFFNKNKKKYTWETPKYKAFVISSTSDSVNAEVEKFLANNVVEQDSLVKVLRKNFGRNIKVERVIAAKGENAVADYLAFGAEKPAPGKSKWVSYTAYNGKIINAPEEVADVRGPVTSDYQAELEQNWVKQLKKKYKVKIKKDVLKNVK